MKKMDEINQITIERINDRSVLKIEKGVLEISDYKIVSSADGTTELTILIKGISNLFETSTNLIN